VCGKYKLCVCIDDGVKVWVGSWKGFKVVEVNTEFLQRYYILKVTVRGKVVYEEERYKGCKLTK